MRIDAEGRGGIRVAESAADCPYGNAFGEQPCCGEVPEIVKPDRFKTDRLPDPNEPFRDFIRDPGSTAVRIEREDMSRFTESDPQAGSLRASARDGARAHPIEPIKGDATRSVGLGVLLNQLRSLALDQ